MKVIVDTNVFVSGVFFSGPPYRILNAWRKKLISLVVSPEIVDEYRSTGEALGVKFPDVDLTVWLQLVMMTGHMVEAPPLPNQVCTDPDDDKFLACALAGHVKIVITGDKALLDTNGYKGVAVMTPRRFADQYVGKM